MAGDKESVPVQRFDKNNSRTLDSPKGGILVLVETAHVVAGIADRVLYEAASGKMLECKVVQLTAMVLMVLEEK